MSDTPLPGGWSIDDVAPFLAVANTDGHTGASTVSSVRESVFTWDYTKGARPALDRLYEKAKAAQWNARTDLPWDLSVDQEAVVRRDWGSLGGFGSGIDVEGTAFRLWGEKEWVALAIEQFNWLLSQFMHGEQGALLCTAKIVDTVPWIDAKYYASTQVMDEARHVEVFSRYLDEKLSSHYPINSHLASLLDDIVTDGRWDVTYLGMQIMVEGLALAAFGFLHDITTEPLLKQLLRLVMRDEARHVAFGVLSLQELYSELSASEIRDRQEFAFEAALQMRDRLLQQEVWDRMGLGAADGLVILNQPMWAAFRSLVFMKVVPNCRKLGLLDAGDGWLRKRFEEIGVIQFQDWPDSEEEEDVFRSALLPSEIG